MKVLYQQALRRRARDHRRRVFRALRAQPSRPGRPFDHQRLDARGCRRNWPAPSGARRAPRALETVEKVVKKSGNVTGMTTAIRACGGNQTLEACLD